MEKIAVHCPTKDLYNAVMKKLNIYGWELYYIVHGNETCVCLDCVGSQTRKYLKKQGYTIIPASEYLEKGGGKVEFKVGDRARLIESNNWSKKAGLILGDIYTISFVGDEWVEVEEDPSNYSLYEYQFKLIKENNMKENNINKNVLEVFGKTVTGEELDIIDRHYNMQMLEVILMDKFKKEIKAACMDAEAGMRLKTQEHLVASK